MAMVFGIVEQHADTSGARLLALGRVSASRPSCNPSTEAAARSSPR